MSASNHTTNYELPIFVGTDKPAWLVEWNGAMTAIDTAIHTAEGKADQAGTDIGGIESSISTINSTLTSINNAVSQLRLDTNANTGAIHTIQELIGNGTPTTTDHTLIGAINEINAKVVNFDFSQASVTVTGNAKVTVDPSSEVNVLLNTGATIGKIYGHVSAGSLTGSIPADEAIVTFTIPGLNTAQAYDVKGYSITRYDTDIGTTLGAIPAYLHFNVGNTVEFRCPSSIAQKYNTWFELPPCLLFLTDLGD